MQFKMLKEIVQYPLTIKGASSKQSLEVKSPYSGEVIAAVALTDAIGIDLAVTQAQETFELTMRHMPAYKRSEILAKAVNLIKAQSEDLARTISLEGGKPIKDARIEVSRAANTFAVASREALRLDGEQIPLDITPGNEGRLGIVLREPIGVIAAITPFNFPLNLVAHKVAPAIAAGNTVVLKPSDKTPITSIKLAAILKEAGLPEGALNLVPCLVTEAGHLVRDSRLALLTFTGSAQVGWLLRAQVHPGVRVVLELGGNAGVIVHNDADLTAAAKAACRGGYANAGQVCISVQRVYVQEKVYDEFLKIFTNLVKELKVGDPLDEQTDVGPLIDSGAVVKTMQRIESAIAGGAKSLIDGKTHLKNLVEPIILINTKPDMSVVCEEIFGPVVSVMKYSHIDEAIAAINNTRYGLHVGVFTKDLETAFKAARKIDVGGVMINDSPNFRADHMPYGGRNESGLGLEGVKYAITEMTQPKFICLNLPNS